MSDRDDGRFGSFLRAASITAAALVAACGTLNPLEAPPVPSGPGTPCTRAASVAADTVVISAGACNPWCIHLPAAKPVTFINHDPALYLFTADPVLPYDVQVPGHATTVTLPLAAGTVTWTAAHQPAATVTIFVE